MQALRLFGFERLTPHLHVRPANLREGTEGVRKALQELGLPAVALVFELGELDPAEDARARALWDGAALVRGYRAARHEIERSSARLGALPESEAMVESFRLGGRVLQQLVLDPLLPAPLVDERERRALLESMRAYDRLGRAAWAGFLGRFGVPHRTAPADTRWAAEGFARSA
jgi:phenylacetic acid degradation operon negative regulatory protein